MPPLRSVGTAVATSGTSRPVVELHEIGKDEHPPFDRGGAVFECRVEGTRLPLLRDDERVARDRRTAACGGENGRGYDRADVTDAPCDGASKAENRPIYFFTNGYEAIPSGSASPVIVENGVFCPFL